MSDEFSQLAEYLIYSSCPNVNDKVDLALEDIGQEVAQLYLNTPIFQNISTQMSRTQLAQLLNYMFFLIAYTYEIPKDKKSPGDDVKQTYELAAASIILDLLNSRSQAIVSFIQSSIEALSLYLQNQASSQMVQIESTCLVRELLQVQPLALIVDSILERYPNIKWIPKKDDYANIATYGQNFIQYVNHVSTKPPSNQYLDTINQYQNALVTALGSTIQIIPQYIQAIENQFEKDTLAFPERTTLAQLISVVAKNSIIITFNSIECVFTQPTKLPELVPWIAQYYFSQITKGYGTVRKLYATSNGTEGFQTILEGLVSTNSQMQALINFIRGLITQQPKSFHDVFINQIVTSVPLITQVVEQSSTVLQASVDAFTRYLESQKSQAAAATEFPKIENIPNTLFDQDPYSSIVFPFINACHNLLLTLSNHSESNTIIATLSNVYQNLRNEIQKVENLNDRARLNIICDSIDNYWIKFSDDYQMYGYNPKDETTRIGFIASALVLTSRVCLLCTDMRTLKVMKFGIDTALNKIKGYFVNLDPINSIITQYINFVNQQASNYALLPTGTASIAVYSLANKAQSAIAQYADFNDVTDIVSALLIVDQIYPTFQCAENIFNENRLVVEQVGATTFVAPIKLFCSGIANFRLALSQFILGFMRVSAIIGLRSSEESIKIGSLAVSHCGFDISPFIEALNKTKENLPKAIELINKLSFILYDDIDFFRKELNGVQSLAISIVDAFKQIAKVAYAEELSPHIGAAMRLSEIIDFALTIANCFQLNAKLLVKPVMASVLSTSLQLMQKSATDIAQNVQDCNRFIYAFAAATLQASAIMKCFPGLEQYGAYAYESCKSIFSDLYDRYLGQDRLQETYNVISTVYNQLQTLNNFIKEQYNQLRAKMNEEEIIPPQITATQKSTLKSIDFTPLTYDAGSEEKKKKEEEEERKRKEKEEEERKKIEEEKKRKEEEKKRKEEEEKRKKEEERKRKEEEERKRKEEEEERKRREEEERKRKEEEERKRREEEERRIKEEKERQRLIEEERRRQEDEARLRKAEEERKRREEEDRKQREMEELRRQEEERLRLKIQEEMVLDSYDLLMQKLQTPQPTNDNKPLEIQNVRRYVDTLKQLIARLQERPDNQDIPRSIHTLIQAINSNLQVAQANAIQ